MGVVLQAVRETSLAGGFDGHAGRSVDGGGVGIVDAVGVAGIRAGKEVLCENTLLAIGIDCATGERYAGIEVADVSAGIGVSGVKFIPDAVGEGQPLIEPPLVLRKGMVVNGFAIV